ncbi:MAG: ATP-binding cassette domain-containing protein [Actinomycetota bacterium]|nr:ATP-binding cassette domain-containing protein [Actinomycetota bacterium]
MLELDRLSRRYGSTVALDQLSLSVPSGQVFGLLGPNGAGKTTAMRAVMGLVALDEGAVTWDRRPLDADRRRLFGYLPEERGLYPGMGVEQQVVYLGRLHGMGRSEAIRAAGEWLDRLGLAERSSSKVEALSLGNQQRVQLAAAMVHSPRVLILDEPFSGLDPPGVDEMSGVLRDQARSGRVVVFSSHQLDLVEHICESAAIVNRGRVVANGSIDELTTGGQRRLVVKVDGDREGAWASTLDGVRVSEVSGGMVRLALSSDVDPSTVLQAALAVGPVQHFAFERRRMSEVFREAVREVEGAATGAGPGAATGAGRGTGAATGTGAGSLAGAASPGGAGGGRR